MIFSLWVKDAYSDTYKISPSSEAYPLNDDSLPGTGAASLYFADIAEKYLVSEKRSLPEFLPDKNEEKSSAGRKKINQSKARALIRALIEGPYSRKGETAADRGQKKRVLNPVIPGDVKLNALFISESGTAYVDFSENIRSGHPGGIKNEMLTLYAVVNTLILNISDIKNVKILIEGREADTLAGHIDIRRPYNANMLIIR